MKKQYVAIFFENNEWGQSIDRVELVPPQAISLEQYCNDYIESIDMADVYEVEIEDEDWINIRDTEEDGMLVMTVCPLEQAK